VCVSVCCVCECVLFVCVCVLNCLVRVMFELLMHLIFSESAHNVVLNGAGVPCECLVLAWSGLRVGGVGMARGPHYRGLARMGVRALGGGSYRFEKIVTFNCCLSRSIVACTAAAAAAAHRCACVLTMCMSG
jgi:hypothetical protein